MGFFSWLFGAKKKRPNISRNSSAVRRLAAKRGVSVYDLDLLDDSIVQDLLLLGLILDDSGDFYYDDPYYVEPPEELVDETNLAVEETDTNVAEEVEILPLVEEPVVENTVVEETAFTPSVPEYEPPSMENTTTELDSNKSWTDSDSGWGDSFNSGGGGGFDSGGGFGDD